MGQFDDIQFINQAQLKQVMLANADKADKRYVKKEDFDPSVFATVDSLGALATKDDVGSEDLDAALAATIAAKADLADVATPESVNEAISTAVENLGLGALATKNDVGSEDLDEALAATIAAKADLADVTTPEFVNNAISTAVENLGLGALATKNDVGSEDLDEALAATIAAKADLADVTTMEMVNDAIGAAIDELGDLAHLDEVAESDLASGVRNKINDVYTKAEVYTREETEDAIDAKVNAKVSGLYKPVGSIAFADLPELSADVRGNVYTVTDNFTTDERFVEEAGTYVTAGTNVAVVEPEEGVFKFDAFATAIDLIDYVRFEDIVIASSAQINEIVDSIYEGMDTNSDPEIADIVLPANASNFAAISNAFADENVTTVNLKLNSDVTVPDRDDGKVTTTFINAGQTVNVDLNGHDVDVDSYMFYVNGGTLTISDSTGDAVITTRRLDATYPAIMVAAGTCILDNVTIDCTTAEVPEGHFNWVYGAVTSGDGVIRMNGGSIKTYDASCMSICNGTAAGTGAKFIVGGDAHLQTVIGPAIYMADQKDVIIKDNAVVEGGIVARMGNFDIKGNAQVINNLDNADNFGVYLTKSGTEATPAGIMLLGGCYQSAGTSDNSMSVSISENAKVSSILGEAIGIAKMDTLYDQTIDVTVANSANLTPADGFDKIKIYTHDELAAIVEAAGKTMAPAAKTTAVTVTVDGEEFYNDAT